MGENEDTTRELLGRAACGDARATEQLLELHRERLLQMVAFRMDRRLSRRIDASDVVQDCADRGCEKTARIRLRTSRYRSTRGFANWPSTD